MFELNILAVPGAVIKECCRSVGVDGVPNIPIIRRLNIGEIKGYLVIIIIIIIITIIITILLLLLFFSPLFY